MPEVRMRTERRVARLAWDAIFVAWIVAWGLTARALKQVVDTLAAPAASIGDSTEALSRRLDDASRELGTLPLVGGDLSAAFAALARQLGAITAETDAQVESVLAAAWLLFWVVWLLPTLTFALLYLPGRIRRARETAAVRRYLAERGDLELFAFRALQHASPSKLSGLAAPPVASWRSGDSTPIRALAEAEFERLGLRLVDSPGEGNKPPRNN